MITLSTERGLEDIQSWSQIEELPGFTSSLNPEKNKLKEILGRYVFKDKVTCGLSNCKQPHNKGYVALTQSGFITNLGSDCGKRYFGVEFKTLSKAFNRAITEQKNREELATFLFQIEEYIQKANSLLSDEWGASQINLSCNSLLEFLPSEVVKNRDGSLYKTEVMPEEEVLLLEEQNDKKLHRPYYQDNKVGFLVGIDVLFDENNLKTLLTIDIMRPLKKLNEIDIDSVSYTKLAEHVKWIREVDRKISYIEKLLGAGRKLFKSQNLLQLSNIMDTTTKTKKLEKWVRSNNTDKL